MTSQSVEAPKRNLGKRQSRTVDVSRFISGDGAGGLGFINEDSPPLKTVKQPRVSQKRRKTSLVSEEAVQESQEIIKEVIAHEKVEISGWLAQSR